MGGHFADDMGFMGIALDTGISGPSIGFDRGPGGDIVLDEGMQACGRGVGNDAQTQPSWCFVDDLDGRHH
jgi:hypothetical protein